MALHLVLAVVLKQGSAREEKAGMAAQVLHLGLKWALYPVLRLHMHTVV